MMRNCLCLINIPFLYIIPRWFIILHFISLQVILGLSSSIVSHLQYTHIHTFVQTKLLSCVLVYAIYSESIVRDFLVTVMSSKGRGSFVCDMCQASFVSLWNLKRHLTAHQGSQFTCGICGAKFAYQYSLVRHTANRHRAIETPPHDSGSKPRTRISDVKSLTVSANSDTAFSLFQNAVSIIL